MPSNFYLLLFISLISISMSRAQLTGLPQSTLHPITSDEPSAAQPTTVPTPPGADTGPASDPVPPTQQNPVPIPTNDPASEESSQVESYVTETLSVASATSAEGHVTAGIGASHGNSGDDRHSASSGSSRIPIGVVIAIIIAVVTLIVACIALLVVRRRRQQRTRRAAAGMRHLKLGGSHTKVQTVAISKPMPVQLGVGYSQHYRAQGYEPESDSYRHSRGSSYDSHETSGGQRSDMYSTIRPGMAGIGTSASIQSSQYTTNSRWSP